MKSIKITEVLLRDGNHNLKDCLSKKDVLNIVKELDNANMNVIEISHAFGLGSDPDYFDYELELITEAASICHKSSIGGFLLPTRNSNDYIKKGKDAGLSSLKIGTSLKDLNTSLKLVEYSKSLGLETSIFIMYGHTVTLKELHTALLELEKYEIDCIYIVDSAGAMLPQEVRKIVEFLKVHTPIEIGFHGHNNLGLAMGNTLSAIEYGVNRIDSSLRGIGAGAGNTQTEALVASLKKMNFHTNIDLYKIMDLAEDFLKVKYPTSLEINKDNLMLGFAGIYSTFIQPAKLLSEELNIDYREILVEFGKQQLTLGDEKSLGKLFLKS